MDCSSGTVYGPSQKHPGTLYLRADCKKLSCEKCGPIKARKYRKAIAKRAEENKLTRFLTLTLDPKKIPAGVDSISYIRKCFAKFRVYLGRTFGKIPYISIIELHQSGIAHLHILIGRYLDWKWIKTAWQAVGGGWKIDIRYVDVHRVSAYLTKYVTKDLLLMVPWRKKRISTSRGIKLFDKKEKSGFSLTGLRITTLFEGFVEHSLCNGMLRWFEYDQDGLVSFMHIENTIGASG